MATTWTSTPVAEVQVGDRVRLASGVEMTVSRIDATFFGRDDMRNFIEDTPERWLSQPMPAGGQVDVGHADS